MLSPGDRPRLRGYLAGDESMGVTDNPLSRPIGTGSKAWKFPDMIA